MIILKKTSCKNRILLRILFIIICLTFLLSLSSCMPSEFSAEQHEEQEEKIYAAVESWLDQNQYGAKLGATTLESGFLREGDNGTSGLFGNTLTDAMYGSYELSAQTHYFYYVMSTNRMYSQDYLNDAKRIAFELYRDGLGFKEEDLIAEEDPIIDSLIPIKYLYDEDDDGKLEECDSVDAECYLPFELKEEEVEDYVLSGLSDGNVLASSMSMTVDSSVEFDVEDLNLEVIRSYPSFTQLMIEHGNISYVIEIEEIEEGAKTKKIISILKVTTQEATETDTSSDTDNTSGSESEADSEGESGSDVKKKPIVQESRIYEYNLETLEFIRDYDPREK